jgi:hypothetical protein
MNNAEVNIILSTFKTSKQIRNSYFVQGVIKKINGTFLIYNVTINYKENKEHPRNIYIQNHMRINSPVTVRNIYATSFIDIEVIGLKDCVRMEIVCMRRYKLN